MQVHPMYRLGALALACGIALSATADRNVYSNSFTFNSSKQNRPRANFLFNKPGKPLRQDRKQGAYNEI
ncbi:hypothetical protein [Pseudomonas nitroreducens]|uniref:hypothetical protein n=1 Tax=Pseudomonas nitroreducens TaxID=46680 RepID=UPI001E5D6C81|nr:hypothetical protein [Pseudomonas nitroreducens]